MYVFPHQDAIFNLDLPLLVSCARSSCDAVIHNHAFLVITALLKIVPDVVLDHTFDILTAVGETTVTQVCSFVGFRSVFQYIFLVTLFLCYKDELLSSCDKVMYFFAI